MATGIVSIAAHLLEMRSIGTALLVVNIISYAILCLLLIARLVRFFPRVKADMFDHVRGPGFFTVAAGTCVLGSQLVIVTQSLEAAAVLWFVGLGVWAVTMYTFFAAITTRETKPSLEKGLSGTWLIAAVSTQSVSVLGTLLAPGIDDGQEVVLFVSLCLYLLGAMLYLTIITLIFYRFTFVALTAD